MLKRRSFWIIAVLLLVLAAIGVRTVVKSRQAARAAPVKYARCWCAKARP